MECVCTYNICTAAVRDRQFIILFFTMNWVYIFMNPCSVSKPFGQSFRNPLCHCLSSFSETETKIIMKQKIMKCIECW